MKRLCGCGFEFTIHYPASAVECYSCRLTNKSAKECDDCGAVHYYRWQKRCSACSTARRIFSDLASGRQIAAQAVSHARVARGLSPASRLRCTDCGGRAKAYDHRDYNRPLDVAPVCNGCNVRRKSAIPRRWTFAEFMAYCHDCAARLPHLPRSWRFTDALAIEKLQRNHFDGPGGVAHRPLRVAA